MQPGLTLNQRYEILGELGRGGMGIVYRALDVRLQREVAIKIFRAPMTLEMNARAQREAQTLAGVSHPNLVRVHSLDANEEGKLMLVFDYVNGHPLSDLLTPGASELSMQQISDLFHQLCLGLQALHEHDIVHRDIKPSNLLVTDGADGTKHLTIIDFGLAKSSQSQKLTATGAVLGTPSYMSPEQFASSDVSAQSDLYSAACVLFEMMCGKPPFENESPYMVASAHLTGTIPELPAHIAHVSELNSFFQTALAKDPSSRYRNAHEMWQAFSAAQIATDKFVGGYKRKSSSRGTAKRGTKLIVGGSALLGALLGLASIAFFGKFFMNATSNETDVIAGSRLRHIQNETWNIRPRNYVAALNETRALIELLNKRGDGGIETARAYEFYGTVLLDRDEGKDGAPRQAIIALKRAQELIDKKGRPTDKPAVLCELANAYNAIAEWQEGHDRMADVAVLRGKLSQRLTLQEASLYAHFLQLNGNFDGCIQLFSETVLSEGDTNKGAMHSLRRDVATSLLWNEKFQEALHVIGLNKYAEFDAFGPSLDARIPAIAYAMLKQPTQSRAALRQMRIAGVENKTKDLQDFYDACEAVNLATERKDKAVYATITRIIAEDRTNPPRTFEGRDGVREHIWNCWLCWQAARRLGWEIQEPAAHMMHQAQRVLENQHCMLRNTYRLP